MVGTIVGAAAAAAAAAIALTGHAIGTTNPATGTTSPFGGSVPVQIAHTGHIEVDLEPSSPLRRVACAGAAPGARCFVAP